MLESIMRALSWIFVMVLGPVLRWLGWGDTIAPEYGVVVMYGIIEP